MGDGPTVCLTARKEFSSAEKTIEVTILFHGGTSAHILFYNSDVGSDYGLLHAEPWFDQSTLVLP